ncbi:branched-chain amino acid ABC transporter permease [Kineobactrum sediminis]|uniref:Branched-chain amino acid ABC transporter permease n=1 Tax=Kineobactrum sediminis TaxID=1905677 RepID=A0A2N5Y1V4_9GAMM|nr:AzlC family ABC transporter permease [Kineobactrum sediminis]PLW82368.1 branched-chain amino acid ABC transporter permease [Kineobactrum sediminis]
MSKRYVVPSLTFAGVRQGFWRLLPLSLFVAAFGLAFGLAAVQTGLSTTEIVLMSATVFAGTAQFAALEMWGAQVPVLPLLATTFAINARMLLMGATLYPWLGQMPVGKRYGSLILLSDANWAMTLNDFNQGRVNAGVLVGGGFALWLTWLVGTLVGMAFGSGITNPAAFGLDMVLGCFMLSMALAGRKNLRTIAAWVVGGLAAYAAYRWLPENSHVIVGAAAGGLVGAFWVERQS